jgi:hypothetical protein
MASRTELGLFGLKFYGFDLYLKHPDFTYSFIVQHLVTMSDFGTFRNLSLERYGNVFVITMQKPPENRLSTWYCQEIIRAFRTVEKLLGPNSEGAVITRGSDAKFWCTVRFHEPWENILGCDTKENRASNWTS